MAAVHPLVFIAVAGTNKSNGVKACRIERDHRADQPNQYHRHEWHRLYHGNDQIIGIRTSLILCDKVSSTGHLLSHGVITKDYETDARASNTKNIAPQYCLSNRTSF